jgi:deoxyribonuclease-4
LICQKGEVKGLLLCIEQFLKFRVTRKNTTKLLQSLWQCENMPKIYVGPAGVPISAKGGSTIDGIKTVRSLGLNAMEVEFVQGVRMSPEMAKEAGKVAKELNVRLSVHAPYFINLCSQEKQKVEASKKRIIDSADRAERMGADAVAIHVGFYGKRKPSECFESVCQAFEEIVESLKENGITNVKLGAETMAKESAFGTLEEVIQLSKRVKGVIPYIDWGHTFARLGGKIDYGQVIDLITSELGLVHINSHFESLVFKNGKYVDVHRPVSYETPPFKPLAQALLKRSVNATIICESPLLEQDALIMKKVLEELGYELE